ncbi:CAAX prenyl protease 2 [Adelges cooleyi]|uniref:CAAX prenyl protease 2 n=1 Tax=Adelges cooleyi TaxID=133065 RepID=UPI00217F620B|nr:CAAX prenyl protease 2 [Adelges cooleyi]XP_050433705.1 CAAX prenyl protease 2 [Adelges cooleyi]XP_050433706.1 CAAX prenyl protease 2 [Adelges cooleyi]XP_050433707.1 CAAX prenyl protease 2 [Adelges cooleyi]
MNTNNINYHCPYPKCVLESFSLSVIYVSSLYVWNSQLARDHPTTIKKRFLSVLFMLIISPTYTWYFIHDKTQVPIWYWLGLKWEGLFVSAAASLLLTSVLFLGSICLIFCKDFHYQDVLSIERMKSNFTDLIWLRNYIVAPISEEFTFRACIIPLLLQCFSPLTTILICPIFFGAAHFNQWLERMRAGIPCLEAFVMSVFQFMYTTIFGAYSALLFISTGNIIAPILAHKFCNHMGFPDFREMIQFPEPKRSILLIVSMTGLILWGFLIVYATEPWIYSNHMDWSEMNNCNETNSL